MITSYYSFKDQKFSKGLSLCRFKHWKDECFKLTLFYKLQLFLQVYRHIEGKWKLKYNQRQCFEIFHIWRNNLFWHNVFLSESTDIKKKVYSLSFSKVSSGPIVDRLPASNVQVNLKMTEPTDWSCRSVIKVYIIFITNAPLCYSNRHC